MRSCCLLILACSLAAKTARTVWDGVYTQAQAERGKVLYTKECAACHGPDLSGGEEAPPLTGGAFLANWNGLTVGELFERIRLSMPEGKAGTLSRQTNADILAFILASNQFPAWEIRALHEYGHPETDRIRCRQA